MKRGGTTLFEILQSDSTAKESPLIEEQTEIQTHVIEEEQKTDSEVKTDTQVTRKDPIPLISPETQVVEKPAVERKPATSKVKAPAPARSYDDKKLTLPFPFLVAAGIGLVVLLIASFYVGKRVGSSGASAAPKETASGKNYSIIATSIPARNQIEAASAYDAVKRYMSVLKQAGVEQMQVFPAPARGVIVLCVGKYDTVDSKVVQMMDNIRSIRVGGSAPFRSATIDVYPE